MRTYRGREEEWEPRLFSPEVTIGAFLLFLGGALMLMWWMGRNAREFNALEMNGVKAAGVVQSIGQQGAGYVVNYAFNVGGAVYKKTEMSPKPLKRGDAVTVTYLRSDPQQFSTIGTPQGAPRENSPIKLFGAMACVAIAITLFTIASLRALRKPKISIPDWYE